MKPGELHTRCPTCKTVFRTHDAQLSMQAGKVRCGQCRMVFDGRAHLVDLSPRQSSDSERQYGPPTVTLRESIALEPAPRDEAARAASAQSRKPPVARSSHPSGVDPKHRDSRETPNERRTVAAHFREARARDGPWLESPFGDLTIQEIPPPDYSARDGAVSPAERGTRDEEWPGRAPHEPDGAAAHGRSRADETSDARADDENRTTPETNDAAIGDGGNAQRPAAGTAGESHAADDAIGDREYKNQATHETAPDEYADGFDRRERAGRNHRPSSGALHAQHFADASDADDVTGASRADDFAGASHAHGVAAAHDLPRAQHGAEGEPARAGASEPSAHGATAATRHDDVVPFRWDERSAPPLSREMRWGLAGASTVLAILLAGQLLFHFRNALAARYPDLRPTLVGACGFFGCRIEALKRRDQITIESHDMQADPAHQGLLILQVTLRNHADHAVAFPNLELEILDIGGQPQVRRAFAPVEYAGGAADFARGIPAGAEWNAKLFIDASRVAARGYNLDLFYP